MAKATIHPSQQDFLLKLLRQELKLETLSLEQVRELPMAEQLLDLASRLITYNDFSKPLE